MEKSELTKLTQNFKELRSLKQLFSHAEGALKAHFDLAKMQQNDNELGKIADLLHRNNEKLSKMVSDFSYEVQSIVPEINLSDFNI